ncbi:glycosyltransferase family 4 protein, partial [Candidatus Borrarchaeum sp.]|uniref:glycosyltransferase family 4 protein n=1 Tax=Candidatus Borrarchaeum sp. TaxID=2846742 RepID=UPI00257C7FE0
MFQKHINILITGIMLPPPYGGLAKRTLNLANVWISKGNQVHLIDINPSRNDFILSGVNIKVHTFDYKNKYFKMIFALLFLIVKNPVFTVKFIIEVLEYHLKKSFGMSGWQPFINCSFRGSLFYSLIWVKEIYQIVKKYKINIITSNYAFEYSMLSLKVSQLAKTPIIITTYSEGLFWKLNKDGKNISPYYSPLFKKVFNKADWIIAPSKHCMKAVNRFLKEKKPTSVIYSPIDLTHIPETISNKNQLRNNIGFSNKKIVLFVGQLNWRKGPDYVIKIAPLIIEKIPNVLFVFIGPDTGMLKKLKGLAISLDVIKYVKFIGTVSEEVLQDYMRVANVLVFPSLTDRECMGMSLKEAQANGTPVI